MRRSLMRRLMVYLAPLLLGYVMKKIQGKGRTSARR